MKRIYLKTLFFVVCVTLFVWGTIEVFRGHITPFVVNESSYPNVALLSLTVDGENLHFNMPELRNYRTVFFDHWPSVEIKQNLHVIEIVVQPKGASIEKHTCTVKGKGIFTWGQIEIRYKKPDIVCGFIANDEFVG
jgi:hypothetical protein